MGFFWSCTGLGATIGAFELVYAIVAANSAPQQAASAALAVAFAVVPYVFTRAIESYGVSDWRKSVVAALERSTKAIEAAKAPAPTGNRS